MNENAMNMPVAGDLAEGAMIQASMSQVEMTIWLCVMAVLAVGMLAILAMVSA